MVKKPLMFCMDYLKFCPIERHLCIPPAAAEGPLQTYADLTENLWFIPRLLWVFNNQNNFIY